MPTDTPLQQVLTAVLSLLAALLAFAVQKITAAVSAKLESQRAHDMLLRLSEQASDVVHELEQTVVSGMRKAADDGKLDRAEIATLRDAALTRLRQLLGAKGKADALKVLGLSESELEALLVAKLEAEVARARAAILGKFSDAAGTK